MATGMNGGGQRVRAVPALPTRPRTGHKGTFGTVLLVAGSAAMPGAMILAANAALRGGAGLVRMALPASLRVPLACAVPSATTVLRTPAALRAAIAAATTVVVGPGLGDSAATRRVVAAVLRTSRVPVVLDADALNVLAPLRAPFTSRCPVVLTPHPGEAARLLGTSVAAVQRDRFGALRALCRRSRAVVVLKGARTLVGDGGRWFENRTGNPGMATGGSGDVLAGLLGALLAQGMAPFAAAVLAAHAHGAAGDRIAARLGEAGLVASDLPLAIAEVLR